MTATDVSAFAVVVVADGSEADNLLQSQVVLKACPAHSHPVDTRAFPG
jgi:hypothetical protein